MGVGDSFYKRVNLKFKPASAIMDISGTVGGFVGFSLLSGKY